MIAAGVLIAVTAIVAQPGDNRPEEVIALNKAYWALGMASWCAGQYDATDRSVSSRKARYDAATQRLATIRKRLDARYDRSRMKRWIRQAPQPIAPPVCRDTADASDRFSRLDQAMAALEQAERDTEEMRP